MADTDIAATEVASEKRFQHIVVTSTQEYVLPLNADGSTLDGRSVDELLMDWFGNPNALNRSHVSRQTHRLGGSETIVSVHKTGIS